VASDAFRDGALRAALVPAFTPRRWRRYLERGGDPAGLLGAGAGLLDRRLGIGRAEAAALARALARARPDREARRAEAAGILVTTWGEDSYPGPLADLADPPPAVFIRGTLLESDRQAVAVVGSRRASRYGLRVAHALAGDLARSGMTVVAGLARGIDAAAHEAALEAGGRTLAVLGSGLLEPYPPEHLGLLNRICEAGAAISEFPLRAPPARLHFPRRNRIIAALSLAVVVVEAAARSGAHSTARHALDLGRSVLAVPGPVDAETSRGTLLMLREGATPVGSAADVFAALGWCGADLPTLPEGERKVLEALGERRATAAEIAELTGQPEEVAAGHLVTLEVRGLVGREGGGTYVAK
jgi:DNA processing protein